MPSLGQLRSGDFNSPFEHEWETRNGRRAWERYGDTERSDYA